MIFYVHYDESTGRIRGYYTEEIHGKENIPSPTIQITEEEHRNIINNQYNTKIYSVENGNIVEKDIPKYVPTLEELKEQKLLEIANSRFIAETSGIEINGIRIHTDRESRGLLTGAALQATIDSNYSCQWKSADGRFIELNAQMILNIATAIRAHVQSQFNHEAELVELVDAAETKEAVENIKW